MRGSTTIALFSGATAAAVAALVAVERPAAAAPPPIAYYPFDAAANDSAGLHTGVLMNGATIVPTSKVGGGALKLDGVDDFVNLVGNDGTTDFGALHNNLSIAAWVNIADPVGSPGVRRVFGNDRFPDGNGIGFGLSGRQVRFTTYGVTDYDSNATTGLIPATPNAWTHIAITFSSSNVCTFYVNGTAVGAQAGGAANTTASPFQVGRTTIGTPATTPAELFGGLVDDLRIYNTTLSAADVAELAALPEPGTPATVTLVAAGGLLARRRRRPSRR